MSKTHILAKYHFHLLVIALVLVGTSLFSYKYWILNLPLSPVQQIPVWTVEAQLNFTGGNTPIKASLAIPNNPSHFRILNQLYVSRRYGVMTLVKDDNQFVVFTLRRAHGLQELFYRVNIYQSRLNTSRGLSIPVEPVKTPPLTLPEQAAINAILQEVKAQSADISTLTIEVIQQLNGAPRLNPNAAFLLGNEPSTKEIATAAIKILSVAKIHAQLLQCLDISEGNQQNDILPWLAVWNGSEWVYFDPITGAIGFPKNYLVWAYGDKPIFEVQGGKAPQVHFSITHDERDALMIAQHHLFSQNPALGELSLFSLPIKTQNVYKQLFMVPFGVFLIMLLRSFIGIKTFGTFMPVLVALAFRETHLFPGILLFTLIVSLGLIVRFYLEQFKLLLVPRLSAVLIVVIMLIAFLNVILNKLGLSTGLSVALFPMVILTMTIERMSVVWEERGGHEAIIQGIGSLFAASLGYFVMENHPIQHLIFVFPELLFILLAIVILMGRYKGYRLVELYRFEDILKDER